MSIPSSSPLSLLHLILTLPLLLPALAQDGNDPLGISHIPQSSSQSSDQDDMEDDGVSQASDSHQYYLIILVVVVLGLVGCLVLFISKRRQTRAIAARARMVHDMETARGQRGLVNDRYGGASGPGSGMSGQSDGPGLDASGPNGIWAQGRHWGRGIPMVTRGPAGVHRARRLDREEGLNERGEAPPPYSKAAKREEGEEVLDHDDANKAPKYEEAVLERPGGSDEVTRPEATHQPADRT